MILVSYKSELTNPKSDRQMFADVSIHRLYYDLDTCMLCDDNPQIDVSSANSISKLLPIIIIPLMNIFAPSAKSIYPYLLYNIIPIAIFIAVDKITSKSHFSSLLQSGNGTYVSIKEMAKYKNSIVDSKRKQIRSALFLFSITMILQIMLTVQRRFGPMYSFMTLINYLTFYLFVKSIFDKEYKRIIPLLEEAEVEIAREYTEALEKANLNREELPERYTKRF